MMHQAAIETDYLSQLMALVSHCAASATPDGMPRTTGSVHITTRGIAWIVTIVDWHTMRQIEVAAVWLDQALRTAAELVGSDDPPWMPIRSRRRP